MMVLEFFIWGAWLPLIFGYLPSLGFTTTQQSFVLTAFPIAAIVGMFFSNQFADRNFAAEKFLTFSHLIGGLAMLGLAFTKSFYPFFGLMLVHCLLYVPTISITNSIAFANLKDAQKEFGAIRMGGTIGWILAAWPFAFILVDWDKINATETHGIVDKIGVILANGLTGEKLQAATIYTFIVSGAASLALSALSLFLPHTPPRKAGQGGAESFAWLESIKLLKHPFVLVLWLVTFVDSFVHNCYFSWAYPFLTAKKEVGGAGIAGNWFMPVMSIGQIAEILTMFILGGTLKKFGWRTTMIMGIVAYPVRFAVWAFLPEHRELIILVQILHGVCYAFFFATVYIFVEEYFPKDVRSSAQGLFNFMILGLGGLAAFIVCPILSQKVFVNAAGITQYRSLFIVPLVIAMCSAIALALFFHPPKSAAQSRD
jgi:nucleoside transporter